MSWLSTVRLVFWMLLRRRVVYGAVGIVTTLLGLAVCSINSILPTVDGAIENSVVAQFDGKQYDLRPDTAKGAAALSGARDMEPVSEESDLAVRSTSGLVNVFVRWRTSGGSETLVTGSNAVSEGEALVTAALAELLAVGPGSLVTVQTGDGWEQVRVRGVFVDPGNAGLQALIAVNAARASNSSTHFLTMRNPYSDTSLLSLVERRDISVAASDSEISSRSAVSHEALIALKYAGLGVRVASILIFACVVAALRGPQRADSDSLCSIGIPILKSRSVPFFAGLVAAWIGISLGFALTSPVLHIFRVPLSESLNQYWISIRTSSQSVLELGATTTLILACGAALLGNLGAGLASPRQASRRIRHVTVGVLMVSLLMMVASQAQRLFVKQPVIPIAIGLAATSVFVAVLPMVLNQLLNHRPGRSLGLWIARMQFPQAMMIVVLACAALFGSFYAASHVHSSYGNREYSSAQQPAGSLAIAHVKPDIAEELIRSFQTVGGQEAIAWILPDENDTSTRVTMPGAIDCLKQKNSADIDAHSECFDDPTGQRYSTLSTIAIGTTPPGVDMVAAPDLVSEGRIGYLTFINKNSFNSSATASQLSALNNVGVDPILGGEMPGAVVNPRATALLRELRLSPSGTCLLLLKDFQSLRPRDQAMYRARVDAISPGSERLEQILPTDLDLRQQGLVGSLGVGAIILVIGAFSGRALITGQLSRWNQLFNLAESAPLRRRVAIYWALPALVSAVAVLIASRWLAYYANAQTGDGFGWEWIIPPVALFSVFTLLAIYLSRRLRFF